MFSATPSWFFFPSDPVRGDLSPKERLRRMEDQVENDLSSHDQLYRLVAYKYLHASGLRIATTNSDIARELRK